MKTEAELKAIYEACVKHLEKVKKPKGEMSEHLGYLVESKTRDLILGRIKDLSIEELQILAKMNDTPLEEISIRQAPKKKNGK